MTLTTHAATGILVAYWFNDPLLGFCAAVISHYILDMIPHGDEFLYWRIVHDMHDPMGRRAAIADITMLIALVIATLLFKDSPHNGLIIWGALGGILPDLVMSVYTHVVYSVLPNASQTKHRIASAFIRLIAPAQVFHKWCHDLIRTPIRLQEGYIAQAIFLCGYIFFFIR